jgi:C1A family cysteine protease
VAFFGLTIKQLEEIPKAAAVIYKNSWGNHVGIFESAESFWIYTYEGNTSTGRSVNKYARKGEGVFYLRTSVNNKTIKPIYYCDCIKQGKLL